MTILDGLKRLAETIQGTLHANGMYSVMMGRTKIADCTNADLTTLVVAAINSLDALIAVAEAAEHLRHRQRTQGSWAIAEQNLDDALARLAAGSQEPPGPATRTPREWIHYLDTTICPHSTKFRCVKQECHRCLEEAFTEAMREIDSHQEPLATASIENSNEESK